MLTIEGTKIKLTRGDTAYLSVDLTNESTGAAYTMEATDKITLTIKRNVCEEKPVIEITNIGANTIHFTPAHTKDLDVREYVYDVQLTQADGDIFTVVDVSKFILTPEVTR